MSDKMLLKEKVMNFFFKKEECRSLSNFWESSIVIDNVDGIREYSSGEGCFHGEKFLRIGNMCGNEERKKELLEYSMKFLKGVCKEDGGGIKKMGRKLILTREELMLWSILSIDVQTFICKYKFENYEEVRMDIVNSGSKILIHPAMRCSEEKLKGRLWEGKGIVVDGNVRVIGRNMLGELWMNVRVVGI
jgi:predicted NAD-dependent protein-ADP-ribosyltransferase YbiA (DUF1768 family)